MVFNFTFNEQQVNVILAGLGELPAKISLDLITVIQRQAQAQIQAAKEAKEETPKE